MTTESYVGLKLWSYFGYLNGLKQTACRLLVGSTFHSVYSLFPDGVACSAPPLYVHIISEGMAECVCALQEGMQICDERT